VFTPSASAAAKDTLQRMGSGTLRLPGLRSVSRQGLHTQLREECPAALKVLIFIRASAAQAICPAESSPLGRARPRSLDG